MKKLNIVWIMLACVLAPFVLSHLFPQPIVLEDPLEAPPEWEEGEDEWFKMLGYHNYLASVIALDTKLGISPEAVYLLKVKEIKRRKNQVASLKAINRYGEKVDVVVNPEILAALAKYEKAVNVDGIKAGDLISAAGYHSYMKTNFILFRKITDPRANKIKFD